MKKLDTTMSRPGRDHGFTLLELLVVIVIIGLLAAYVGPKYFSQLGKSEVTVARAQIEAFDKSLDTYRLEVGRYPTAEEGLNALIAAPPGHPVLAAILDCLPAAMARLPRAPAWWVTGPVIFTLFARLAPLGIAADGIIAGRLPEGAPPAALAGLSKAEGLLIDWKSWAPPAPA